MTKLVDEFRIKFSIPTLEPLAHTLLIVEDDGPLLQRLACVMETRGCKVSTAESVADGLAQFELSTPA